MPRMFPREMPEWVRQNTLRSTECRVYDALASQLSGSWSVFYSRPWLGLAPDGREIDGEADFVLAHPGRGVITVEVKGGIVARDGVSDRWTTRDRHGILHNIKNPVKQARDSKYQLLEKLKAHPRWRPNFIAMTYGVLLPDCERPAEDLGPEMPLEIFGFADDMEALERWAEVRLTESGHQVQPPGADGIAVLEDLLARSFELRTSLRSALAGEDATIQMLTEQQFHILDYVTRVPRLVVEGGAGSGKTIIAAELAARCSDKGESVLVTCFNRPLAEQLKRSLKKHPGVVVRGFHEMCVWMAGRAGMPPPIIITGSAVEHEQQLGEDLIAAFARTGESFDVVIVDEAQDFRRSWIVALEVAASRTRPRFYIFCDNNQRIYSSDAALADFETAAPYPLNRNLRNTREIFEVARRFYSGEGYISAGPAGQAIEWVVSDDVGTEDLVLHALSRLISKEMLNAGDIAVLSCGNRGAAERLKARVSKRYTTTDAEVRKHGCVVIDTVRRFKGLESRIVILTGIEAIADSDELAYVAFSRAKLYMVVIGSGSAIEYLRRI